MAHNSQIVKITPASAGYKQTLNASKALREKIK